MYNPFSILFLAISAGAIAIAVRTWLQRRSPAYRTPIRAIAIADETGINKIRGVVEVAEALRAPITGRACVYYRIELRVLNLQRDRFEHRHACDFVVRDATGVARVIVEGARFEVVADIVEIGRASELSDRTRSAFGQHGVAIPEIAGVEVREAIVAAGATIDIVGHLVREPATEPPTAERGFRDPVVGNVVFSGDVLVVDAKREPRYIGARR